MKKNIIIFGTGKFARRIAQRLNKELYNICYFWDNDPQKTNQYLFGIIIEKPNREHLKDIDQIMICSIFYNEIESQLRTEFQISQKYISNYLYPEKIELLKKYATSTELEVKKIIKYLNTNNLEVFNYPFRDKYNNLQTDIIYDEEYNLYFVLYQGKKLYLKKELNTIQKVQNYYRSLLMEQDKDSPHRYCTDYFYVEEGDIVIDAGTAEGNFALSVIDKVSKIYLIEDDSSWIEALRLTFAPYQEKVEIIPKTLNTYDTENSITIDTINTNNNLNFIKMDIEGVEKEALQGAKYTLANSSSLKLAICTYHYEREEKEIYNMLLDYNLEITYTNGYMFYIYEGNSPKMDQTVSLRRGIIQAKK